MATPVDVIYNGPSPIHAGFPAGGGIVTPSSQRLASIGDSLTTHLLGYNWSPIYWINGLGGGSLQPVANLGVAGETLGDIYARLDNQYTDASPGFGGLAPLGHIVFRAMTNNARQGDSAASLSALLTTTLDKIGTKGELIYLLSVPPIGPSESSYATKNALTLNYNDLLIAYAAANPTKFIYVPDSDNLRDVDGSQLAGYFQPDGIHNLGAGTQKEGIDGYASLAATLSGFGYASPVSHDAADVYPAQPQWFVNPAMTGVGGVANNGFIGAVVDGVVVTTNGSGQAGACAIVAADVGDTNTAPWQRVTPTQVTRTGAGETIRINSTLAGRTITTVDPSQLDMIIEIRLNAFDTTYVSVMRLWVQGSSGTAITEDLDLKMGGGVTTKTVVLRLAMPRKDSNAHTNAFLFFDLLIAQNFTGSMGSFDFRCLTIRG